MPATRSSINALRQMVRTVLLADDELQNLLGGTGAVYSAHIQDADAGTVPMPSVIFEFISGSSRWHGYVQSQVAEIYAYSKVGPDECTVIYDRLYDVLQHERLVQGGTGDPSTCVIFEVQRPVEGYNKTIRAWFIRGRWQINGT